MQITLRPTLKQHLAYQALNNPEVDVVFFGGGAGGGKTWAICESRLVRALQYPGYKSFIGREELKRLMQSTFVTWSKVCSFHKIPKDEWKLNGQYNYIEFRNGSRIDLLDLKFNPSDPLYERFGSLEYTDGAIEEAGEVEFLAFDVLKSRVGRHLNKELNIHPNLFITGNPKQNWTHSEFYLPNKRGNLPKNHVFIQALYRDNPHTASEYGRQLEQIRDEVTRERLKEGNWDYSNDPSKLISFDAISDLFTNAVDESNEKYLVCDAARMGGDKITISYWEGLKAVELYEYQYQPTTRTQDILRNLAQMKQVPFSHVLVDEDGIGGGIVDNLLGIKGFTANAIPFDNLQTHKRDNYANLKAQCGYMLADMVNSHKLAVFCPDMGIRERLTEELQHIKAQNIDNDEKKLRLVPKDEVKKSIGRSPDWSDNLLMRMYFEVSPKMNAQASVYYPKHTSQNYKKMLKLN